MKLNIKHIIKFSNIVVSTLLAIFLAAIFYKRNIFSYIDNYNEFIYGDTIYVLYSKYIDILVVVLFGFILLISYSLINYIINKLISPRINHLDSIVEILWKETYIRIALKVLSIGILSWYSSFVLNWLLVFKIELGGYIYIRYIVFVIIFTVSVFMINKKGTLLSQIFLPLIFLSLMQKSTYYVESQSYIIYPNVGLRILSGVLIILSYYYIFKAYKNNQWISFSTIIVLLFLLNTNGNNLLYPSDEYHIGEMVTSYQQIYILGQDSYAEYIPVKGYMHIFAGFINHILFDNNYNSIIASFMMSAFILLTLFLGIIKKYIKTEYLFILLLCSAFVYNQYILIPIFLLVLMDERIWKNNINYLVAYLYMAYIYILFYQSFGVAFSVALFPIFIWKLWLVIKYKKVPNIKQIILIIMGVIILFINLSTLIEIAEYSLLNSKSNLYYWGNFSGFSLDFTKNQELYFWFNFIIKSSWIFVWMFSIINLAKNVRYKNPKNILINTFFTIYPVIILSYMYARIDGNYARANSYT
jgi:hypothetical protein